MNYYTIGANFVFALNLMLPEGDRKDRPYANPPMPESP